jgi:hypothetical protein
MFYYKAWRKIGPTLKSPLIPHLTHFVTWRFKAIIKNASNQAKNLDDDLTRKYSSVTNQSQSKEAIQVIGIIYPASFGLSAHQIRMDSPHLSKSPSQPSAGQLPQCQQDAVSTPASVCSASARSYGKLEHYKVAQPL